MFIQGYSFLSSQNNTKSDNNLVKQGRSTVCSEEEVIEDKLESDIPTLGAEQRTREAVPLLDEWG